MDPAALHELDPVFRKVTLENQKVQAVARDLAMHVDPVGMRCARILSVIFS